MDRGESVKSEKLTELAGSVAALIYQSPESGYAVLRLDTHDDERITAVGTLPYLAPGERLNMMGVWTSHPVHGNQFKIHTAQRELPSTEQGIYEYLASGTISGVGPATARAVIDAFGVRALEVMEEEPEKLGAIKGITTKKAEAIAKAVRKQAALRLLISFLAKHGLPTHLAIKLYQYFGDEALSAVRDDPYLLADPDFGGDFHLADGLALSLGFEGNSMQRLMAATMFTLSHNLQNGHSFIPRDKLTTATAELLGVPPDLCESALDALIETGRIVQDDLRGILACYLDYIHAAEETVAARIHQMVQETPAVKVHVDDLLHQVEEAAGLTYAPEQRRAVVEAAQSQVLLITGAPGTGKTTSVRAILELFDILELETVLAAPTGRAAKRMSELTGRDAVTIHRLLGACPAEDGSAIRFERDESDPLEASAVILDETSMVDILLAEALIRALPKGCKLVLVGDADQLPSVGPGNVFSDLIRSGAVPVVRLTEIFRQAKESGIITNAHTINQGVQLDLKKKEQDFFFLGRSSAAQTVKTVVDLVARRLPENMQMNPQDIQVLCPFKRGSAGTISLNLRLQEALNPKSPDKPERKFGEYLLRKGDKVMQIRNNYDIMWTCADGTVGQGVFNGDIGRVLDIDLREGTLTAEFDGREVLYQAESALDLEPAWAMTVHKSQGSEYRAVVFVTLSGPPMLLNRTVLYTGVTRARELLILVGEGAVVHEMAVNTRQQKRYSGLKLRLADT